MSTSITTYAKKEILNETNENGSLKFIRPYSQNIVFSLANSNVTSVNIPKNLLGLDEKSFMNCQKLSAVTVDEHNPKYDSRDNCNAIIETEANKLIFVCKNGTVPSDVIEIGPYAFNGFESIEIGENVEYIDPLAFYYCDSLSSLTVNTGNDIYYSYGNIIFNRRDIIAWGNNITIPGEKGFIVDNEFSTEFYDGTEIKARPATIKSVVIESGITSIGYGAFTNQPVTSITIPSSVTGISSSAFYFNGYILKSNFINNSNLDAESNGYWGARAVDSMNDGFVISGNTLVKYIGNSNSVTIPNSVTSIGESAFSGCSGLASVTIPNSVTSIGRSAFYNCSSLTSVTIGNSVTSIGESAFNSCSGLTSVTIPNSVTSINGYVFAYCSSLTSITIPNSVTSIGVGAFKNCNSLTSITIPDSVTTIGSSAFTFCSGTTSVTIGSGVTNINEWAFNYCSGTLYYNTNNLIGSNNKTLFKGFDNIVIKPGVTSISEYVFRNCDTVTSVTIPDSVTSIGFRAFEECSSLTSVNIPDSVTSIGGYAFYNCNSLPCENNVLYADKWAVRVDNSSLLTYTLRTNTKGIADDTFHYCSSLTSITIPNSVTSIGSYAFGYCSSLTNITIPNSVTSIGTYAFTNCRSLTSATIGTGVTSISEYAFYYCSALASITIPDSVTAIGNSAFYYCSGLTSVTIGNSVTNIGWNAFQNCSSLTSVTIGNSVTNISGWAFQDCSGLTSITSLAATAPTILGSTFRNVKTNGTLTVPSGSSGYDVWMGTGDYYLGKYGWTKVEQ